VQRARLGAGLVLTVALVSLGVGFAHKSLCMLGGFDELKYRAYCYSDIEPLLRQEGLAAGKVPYLEARNEYPVLTGLVMWVASLPGEGEGTFLVVNVVFLTAVGLSATWLLYRLVGDRAMYLAAAPTLVLSAFMNWDLVPVALTIAATWAFLRRRDGPSGAFLGLGASAKVYPALLVLPFAADRWREGERRRAALLAAMAAGAWLVVDLPFAFASFERWSYFFRFSADRAPTFGTVWFATCHAVNGRPACGSVAAVNLLSVLALVGVVAVVWRAKRRREPDFERWTLGMAIVAAFLLTAKVYSPQYSLWLVPWFALALPNLRLFVLFEAADVAVFFGEFAYLRNVFQGGAFPAWALGVLVVFRASVLVAVLVAYVREGRNATNLQRQIRVKMSPSASS
jgi:hypothetical protein